MVPEVGQRVGPYEILGRLGSGGMGLVFSAWDARLHRDVAIKLLREEYATPEMRSRFLQEARAASGLNHANICTIFDIGEQDGEPYLVMELLKGETLRQRMNSGGLEPREICRVAHDVADALSLAHSRGVIHRDIKPANIFVVDRPGGGFSTKVLDFGLAKMDAYGTDSLFDLTHTGTTVGTVSYMSPEQARGESLDPRSDLFSLGVVLYEMATGRLPFQGATSALVFVELLSKAPDPIRPQNPTLSPELEQIILRLLEKDRTLRFQNGHQIMEALVQIPSGGSAGSLTVPAVAAAAAAPSSQRGDIAPRPRTIVQVPQPSRHDVSAVQRAWSPVPENGTRPPAQPEARPSPVSPDEILRPRPRVVAGESSSLHRAALEIPPADALPKPPSDPPSETGARIVPHSASPSNERNDAPRPPRPIIRESERSSSSTPVPPISLPRIASPRPAPRFSRYDELDEDGTVVRSSAPGVAPEAPPKPKMWMLLLALIAMAVIGLVAWNFWPRSAPASGGKIIPLVVTPVSGGDNLLAGAVTTGLMFDLSQSPQFLVIEPAALNAGLHSLGINASSASADDMRRAAQAIGATEILYADLRHNGGAYSLSLHINAADSGAEIFHAEQTAQNRDALADAVDRLATDLRSGLGEDSGAISRTSVPLRQDATPSIEALSDYAVGLELLSTGKLQQAAAAFEHAISTDAHFTQADLRLADIYRTQHALVAAASASVSAQASSSSASPRTQHLANASYALNATGDLSAAQTAAQEVIHTYPAAIRARIDAAEALREQGKFVDSHDMIARALQRQPYNNLATVIQETDLLGQERALAARNLEDKSAAAGHPHPDMNLLITFLVNGTQGPVDVSTPFDGHIALGEIQAALLDATGSMHAGLHLWQAIVAEAGAHDSLFSAAGDALSIGALDRALMSDCAGANAFAEVAGNYPLSAEARFRSGMAAGLCGDIGTARSSVDTLSRSFTESFVVKQMYVPQLNALIAWKSGHASQALATLEAAKQFDNISLSPLLRGLIHSKGPQPLDAIPAFQVTLNHPQAAALVNPSSVAAAQLGLARAYAASGDHTNSAKEYSRFLKLWSNADPGSPLVAEARANSR